MKLTVIGGGGVRAVFLAKSIAQRAGELDIDRLVFMDNDERRLSVFGEMAGKICRLLAPRMKFSCTTNAVEAFIGADYVITAIRVGGDDMRVKDEKIALDLGVLGEETTGAAGFSFAMRSIPALISYCEYAKKYAKPDVKLLHLTDPVGLVTQALRDCGFDFCYGLCDTPSEQLSSFADLLNISHDRVRGEVYGLNHLSFFDRITVDGKDITDKLLASDLAFQKTDLRCFSKKLLRRKGYIPNVYLYYYFSSDRALGNILTAEETRGEQIARLNRQMLEELKERDVTNEFDACLKIFEQYYGLREMRYMESETGIPRNTQWRFNPFSKDESGYGSVALRFIELDCAGVRDQMILCVPNGDTLPGLLPTDVIETTCDVAAGSVIPHKTHNFDPDALELIRRVKRYERGAAKAILTRDAALAVDTLALHPLVNSYDTAEALVEKYIRHNFVYCPGWRV